MSSLLRYFVIEDAIGVQTHAQVLEAARAVPFLDGSQTAGRWDGQHKQNHQAPREAMRPSCDRVMDELTTHRTLCRRALPHRAVQPTLNRYRAGDHYGPHEDSPIQDGIRADLSYTLFLCAPSEYEGGELRLGEGEGAVAFKLPARSLVCYPSGTLHQVLPVRSGERLALIGWIQSIVRDPVHRSMLSELRDATDALTDRPGLEAEVAALSRVYGGLLRRWAFD